MKPVIKRQTHYSVLFMRDDSEARTFRMHSRTLRFLICAFLLLVVGGGAGIAGGVHYWKKYRALSERYEVQEKESGEMRLQLERLVALETVISASNGTVPQSRHAVVGLAGQTNASQNLHHTNATGRVQNATVQAGPIRGNGTQSVDAALSDAPESGDAASGNTGDEPDAAAGGEGYPLVSSQASPLRISAFIGRPSGQQRLRISYELFAEGNDEQRTISGVARYFAIFANGTRVEMPAQDNDGARFAITRMKQMQSWARLPQGYKANDVQQLDILIELSENEKYVERFDLTGAQ